MTRIDAKKEGSLKGNKRIDIDSCRRSNNMKVPERREDNKPLFDKLIAALRCDVVFRN
jgi:hypothetical protein